MKAILAYVVARLAEPSSWRGVIALLTATGATITPDQANAIVAAGLGVIGLIGVFFKDKITQ